MRDIECPFCGFACTNEEINFHLVQCDEALAVKSMLGADKVKLPDSVTKGRTQKGFTFLKVRNLTKGKETIATILDFGEADKNMPYSDYLIDISIGKIRFTHGFRTKSEDLQAIASAYGDETNTWKGKEVVCTVGQFENAAGKISDIVVMRPRSGKKVK
jgi:hypothetical protein